MQYQPLLIYSNTSYPYIFVSFLNLHSIHLMKQNKKMRRNNLYKIFALPCLSAFVIVFQQTLSKEEKVEDTRWDWLSLSCVMWGDPRRDHRGGPLLFSSEDYPLSMYYLQLKRLKTQWSVSQIGAWKTYVTARRKASSGYTVLKLMFIFQLPGTSRKLWPSSDVLLVVLW